MATFQGVETIVIKGTIKDEGGVLVTPTTSTVCTITDPAGVEVVAASAVIFDTVGTFRFLYTPAADPVLGAYHVRITATDAGPRLSITDSEFFLTG